MAILKADTIKQVELKEKIIKKSISGEPESYSRQNYGAETSSSEYTPGLFPYIRDDS